MYKLVISKFERALIDSDEAISTSTIMKIDKIRSKKVLFCILTERPLNDVLAYNKDFSFVDYIIACDGAYLYDVVNDKTIYKKNITNSILKKILNNFSNYKIYATSIDERFLITEFTNKKVYSLEIDCKNKNNLSIVENKLEELNLNISILKKENTIKIIMDSISCNKAIEKICTLKKIDLKQVVGIGVDETDIPMIKLVGMKIAMGNASESLKKEVQIITSTNDEKGVKNILDQLFN